MDDNTNLYIVSDHGFGPYEKRVYLNQWLEKESLLHLRRSRLYLSQLLRKIGLKKVRFSDRSIAVASNPIDHCIDFEDTLFYCSDVYEQGIYLNNNARVTGDLRFDYERERNLLRDKLLMLVDPTSGEQLIDEVLFREQVHWGPYVDLAPDLFLKIRDYGYLLNKSISLKGDRFLQSVAGPEGCHRSEGIFAAYGRGIRKAKAVEASIFDITPTVLYNYGIPVPREMDGRVLNDIFRHEFQESTRIRYREAGLSSDMQETFQLDYTGNEEDEIKRRLKDLGYLD
jgi:predicted AlkP superfamily phosphohydrolase/phosphomutase